jgi:predicted SPOUT superfamily RNA methylase MTH1
MLVDVGLRDPISCIGDGLSGDRLTVKLMREGARLTAELFDVSKINIYWGYRVKSRKIPIGKLVEKEKYDLKIGTSHYGSSLVDCWSKINSSFRDVKSALIVFGSPKCGLRELLSREGKQPEEMFDYYVNTVPKQNVSTVRAEEAIMVTLGLLNLARVRG